MPEAAPAPPGELSHILVLQLCPIGDTLFGTPALRALRYRYPQARITVVTWAANREVLAGNPHIHRLVLVRSAFRLPRVLSRLAEENFDAVVGLSNIGSWLTLFTSFPVRVGFSSQTLGWLYTAQVPDRRDRHAVDYCLDVVAALGALPRGRHLEIALGEADREFAARILGPEQAGEIPPLRVAIHPGGRHFPAKRWSVAGFAEVADYLAGQYGAQVVLVGGPDDVPLAQAIAELCRLAEPVVTAGRSTLKQTAAILERCDLFVGNDSAPAHLAAAVGTPAVVLFGPTSVDNFGPLGPFDVVVRRELPCSPCFRWLGGSMQHLTSLRTLECNAECMRSITPQAVVAAIERQLDRLQLRTTRRLERPAWVAAGLAAAGPGVGLVAGRAEGRPSHRSVFGWRRLRRPASRRGGLRVLTRLGGSGREPVFHKVQEFEEL